MEINGLLQDFNQDDLNNFYADGFIDYGFIILFTAAFPIGAFVGVISMNIEIRNKI